MQQLFFNTYLQYYKMSPYTHDKEYIIDINWAYRHEQKTIGRNISSE